MKGLMDEMNVYGLDFEKWFNLYLDCACALNKLKNLCHDKDYIKCHSSLCVINNAIQDIENYFKSNSKSRSEFCFLIRNIDVIIDAVLQINNILFGVGLNKQDKAIVNCFDKDFDTIKSFRTLRSLILAHPVDTHYNDESGSNKIVYLEDFRPFTCGSFDLFSIHEPCDYILQMHDPKSDSSFKRCLTIENNIIPVIFAIMNGLKQLHEKIDHCIIPLRDDLISQKLNLDKSSMINYIKSLNKELELRYPSAIEDINHENKNTEHFSIVFECLMFYQAKYNDNTQKKYAIFLNYLKNELEKIETDLQNMQFDENRYFSDLNEGYLTQSLGYEESKMTYLRDSEDTSYTTDFISTDTESDVLWGIYCFRKLIPYINKYIPVDTSVSDKELYCQYVAANYLCYIQNL